MQPPRSAKLPISTLLHCIQFTANHCNAQGLVVSNVKPGGTFELQHENPKCALLCGQHLMLMVGKIYGEPSFYATVSPQLTESEGSSVASKWSSRRGKMFCYLAVFGQFFNPFLQHGGSWSWLNIIIICIWRSWRGLPLGIASTGCSIPPQCSSKTPTSPLPQYTSGHVAVWTLNASPCIVNTLHSLRGKYIASADG